MDDVDASTRDSMMQAWFQRLAGMICSVDVKLDRLSNKVDYLTHEINDIKTTLVNADKANAENTMQAASTADAGSQNVTDERNDTKKTISPPLRVTANESSQIQAVTSADISSQYIMVEKLSADADNSQIEVKKYKHIVRNLTTPEPSSPCSPASNESGYVFLSNKITKYYPLTTTDGNVVPTLSIRSGNSDDIIENHESRPPVHADDAESDFPEKTNPITLDIDGFLNTYTVLPRRHSNSTESVESYESDSVYMSVPNETDDAINQLCTYLCPLLENAGNTNSEMLGGIDTSVNDESVDEITTLGIARTVEKVGVDQSNENVSDNVGVEDGTVTMDEISHSRVDLVETCVDDTDTVNDDIANINSDKSVDEITTLGIARTVEGVAVDKSNDKVSDNMGGEDGTVTMDGISHSPVDLVETWVDDTDNDDISNINSLPADLMDTECSQSIKDNNDTNISGIHLHINTDDEDFDQAIAELIHTSKRIRQIIDTNDAVCEVSADSSLPLSGNMTSASDTGIEEIIPDPNHSDSDVQLTDHSIDYFKAQNVVSSTNVCTSHSAEAWNHGVWSKGIIADDVNMKMRADTDNASDERHTCSVIETASSSPQKDRNTDNFSEIPKTPPDAATITPPDTQDPGIGTDSQLAPPMSSSLCIEQHHSMYPVECYKRRKTNQSDDNRISYFSVDRTNDGGENDDNCETGDQPDNGQTTHWSIDSDSLVLPSLGGWWNKDDHCETGDQPGNDHATHWSVDGDSVALPSLVQPLVSEMESSYTDDSVASTSMVSNAYKETMTTDQQSTEEPIQTKDIISLPFGTRVVVSSTWSGDESRKNIVGTVISDGKKGIVKVLWDDGEEDQYGLEELDAANIVQTDAPQPLVENNYVWYGSRVIRGPHWKWAEQDGGEGNVGVVCKIEAKPKGTIAHVIWPHCGVGNYRFGFRGKYDILISPQWVYEETQDVWKPYCAGASRDIEAAFQDKPDSSLVVAVNSTQHAIDLTNLLARVVTNPTTVYYIRRIGNPEIA